MNLIVSNNYRLNEQKELDYCFKVEEVEKALQELGYLGVITFNKEASDTVDEGKVISQSIQNGIETYDNYRKFVLKKLSNCWK